MRPSVLVSCFHFWFWSSASGFHESERHWKHYRHPSGLRHTFKSWDQMFSHPHRASVSLLHMLQLCASARVCLCLALSVRVKETKWLKPPKWKLETQFTARAPCTETQPFPNRKRVTDQTHNVFTNDPWKDFIWDSSVRAGLIKFRKSGG